MIEFYVSCPIDYENDLVEEIKSFWFEMIDLDGLPTRQPLPEIEISIGGVQFRAEEHLGYQINFFSKIANRVLVRIAKFDCRYYDQVEKEILKIKLDKWLAPQSKIFVKTDYHKSRLNNEKNILEAAGNSLKKMGFISAVSDENEQILFLRFEKDRATVSLDTSGEHLHRRGYGVYRGEAPIRENLAAIVVRQLHKFAKTKDMLTIVDPFSGSGTMLFEAASMFEPNFQRDYSWLKFLNTPKLFKSDSWKKNYRWLSNEKCLNFFGIDLDEKSHMNANKNEKLLYETFSNVKSKFNWIHQDSLTVDFKTLQIDGGYWIVTNPPYGHRLSDNGAVAILEHFETDDRLSGLVVIHPESWRFSFKRFKLVSKLDFKNQGLNLKLSVYSH